MNPSKIIQTSPGEDRMTIAVLRTELSTKHKQLMECEKALRVVQEQHQALAAQYLTVLIEHHQGRCVVQTSSLEMVQQIELGVRLTVNNEGDKALLVVIDAATDQPLIVDGIGSGQVGLPSQLLKKHAPPAPAPLAEPEPQKCPHECCRRNLPFHTLDCPDAGK